MNNPYYALKPYEMQEIKYDKFCKILGIEKKTGKAKILQLNQIKQYVALYQQNRKIFIEKVYKDEEIEKLKNDRYFNILNKMSADKNRYENFNISKTDAHKGGIYKIQLNNIIYIGQTNDFQKRFKAHWDSDYSTQTLLKDGAEFSILEIEDSIDKRLEKESNYIKFYSTNKKYNCINKKENKNNKIRYKTIKIKESEYDRAITLLKEKGIL